MVLSPGAERSGQCADPVWRRLELNPHRWGGSSWAHVDAREAQPVCVGRIHHASFGGEGESDPGSLRRGHNMAVVAPAGVGQHWAGGLANFGPEVSHRAGDLVIESVLGDPVQERMGPGMGSEGETLSRHDL